MHCTAVYIMLLLNSEGIVVNSTIGGLLIKTVKITLLP